MCGVSILSQCEASGDLDSLADKLAKEIYLGRMHLWVWLRLNNELVKRKETYPNAPFFWQMTLRAHCDEAFYTLRGSLIKSGAL